MTQNALLPPAPPDDADPSNESGLRLRPISKIEEPSLLDLAAMAKTTPPPAIKEEESDGLVDLASWKPSAPSAFPEAWLTAPPPSAPRRGLRLLALASVMIAVAGIAVAGTLAYVNMTQEPMRVQELAVVEATGGVETAGAVTEVA